MSSGIATKLSIKRKMRDGWYVYTCDKLPGLYVASHDDRKAFDDVPRSVEMLLRLDFGVNCTVRWSDVLSYDHFIQRARLKARAESAVKDRTDELIAGPKSYSLLVQTDEHGNMPA